MFKYAPEEITGTPNPTGMYSPYKEAYLFTPPDTDRPNTLADGYPRPMAVCYYYPRPDKAGLERYIEADNAAYTAGHKGGDFREFLRRLHKKKRWRPDGQVLLIAPGLDRKYFTDDDITN